MRVFEARELLGSDLKPLLRVLLDRRMRSSMSQHGNNSPSWNETFTFVIKKTPEELMHTCLEFRVILHFE